ncbi:MAG: hypothetical protein JO029_14510 [Candidatus Eremiobacteraeota bacterium]|nr:hypothetical protein [Candidatus Eremiobacteraeota bacterium]MBV8435487.1 hypothetical protein [Candidatus Eremiobacteraeota bacterium]
MHDPLYAAGRKAENRPATLSAAACAAAARGRTVELSPKEHKGRDGERAVAASQKPINRPFDPLRGNRENGAAAGGTAKIATASSVRRPIECLIYGDKASHGILAVDAAFKAVDHVLASGTFDRIDNATTAVKAVATGRTPKGATDSNKAADRVGPVPSTFKLVEYFTAAAFIDGKGDSANARATRVETRRTLATVRCGAEKLFPARREPRERRIPRARTREAEQNGLRTAGRYLENRPASEIAAIVPS